LKLYRFYEPRGLKLIKGLGQYVWDSNGRRYIDAHNGNGVGFLGHGNQYVVSSIKEQLDRIFIASSSYDLDVAEEALDLLSKIVPPRYDNVSFLNSGAEAVELAIKMARIYAKRRKIVYFTGSFHGRTLGALSVTGNKRYWAGLEGLDLGTISVEFTKPEELRSLDGSEVAAVILEIIQGEGGVNPASKELIEEVKVFSDKWGSLIIVDEIQTGFGRTGIHWSFMDAWLEPHIFTAGKAMAGGFPISAVFFSSEIASKMPSAIHGSTFGGNPLALAALRGGLRAYIADRVWERSRESGSTLMGKLRETLGSSRLVREVRGRGLMIGVDLKVNPINVVKCLQEKGVLATRAGTAVVRFLPPYMITKEDIEEIVGAMASCIGGV
jgi:acetylornithine/LysW-gamma-L-lysine aminotransferase